MILENALKELKNVLTDQYVRTDTEIRSQYESGTYNYASEVAAVVFPLNTDQVCQCVEIANKYKIPLYPISRGRNWGYGSRAPVQGNCICLDLSRMDQIRDHNEEFGYVTIQPGVTLETLHQFLRKANSKLILSTTGGSTGSSLIGNTMERGIATGLYADRFANVCDFEVVLPNGKLITTGFGRYEGEHITSKLFKWGVGPYLDGIFTQSNLGIVTSLTLWLQAIPEYYHFIHYEVNEPQKFYRIVDELHGMTTSGLVRPTLTMYNNFRVLSTLRQYPREHNEEIQSLPKNKRAAKMLEFANAEMQVPLWTGEICIRGVSAEHALVQSRAVIEKLAPYAEVNSFEIAQDEMVKILKGSEKPVLNTPKDIVRSYLVEKYLGIPSNIPINQSYWRKSTPIPATMCPDSDQCGMIWICPIAPFSGAYIKHAIDIIEQIITEYGYEPAISLQCMSERSIHIIASIAWDREIPTEDEKALQCYTELHRTLHNNGFYFYRETTYAMTTNIVDENDEYNHLLNNIKRAMDPNSILAPGRYIKEIDATV